MPVAVYRVGALFKDPLNLRNSIQKPQWSLQLICEREVGVCHSNLSRLRAARSV